MGKEGLVFPFEQVFFLGVVGSNHVGLLLFGFYTKFCF